MCFGGNKTTTNNDATTANTASSAPTNPAIAPAVTNEVNAATSLASQPLQQYTGSLVAPLTADQNTAIGQIDANSTYTPTPFSASAVDQYESPYTADVLNTTEAAENLQDQQQQQSLAGGITAAGAFGGDRQAVVQSELAGQQDTANNVTNANIENQGYTQALGQFNTTNQLGLATQQANLAGASSLLNAGTLEQQVNQENLDVPYEQYLQQEAYPYQQLDFESGILGSAAGTSGTTTNQSGSSTGTNTSSTSTPLGSQLLGLGLSAASFLKTGGRAKLASGGLSDAAYMPLPTPVAISSFIPSSSSSKGGLQSLSAGSTPSAPGGGSGGNSGTTAPSGLSQGMSEGNQIGTALESPGLGGYLGTDPTYTGTNAPLAEGLFGNAGGYGGVFGSAPTTVSAPDVAGPSDFSGLGDFSLPDFQKGGRTRLADGGTDDGDGFDALLDSLYQPDQDSVPVASPTSLAQAPAGATAMSLADTPPAWRAQATNYATDPSQSTSLAGPTPSDVPTGYVPLGPDSPISLGAGPSPSMSTSPTWDDGTPVIATDDEGQGPNDAPASLAAAPAAASNTSNPGLGTSYAPKIIQNAYTAKPDWRRALLTAGTSMMAANTGNGLTNVGAGLKAGANEYYDQLDKDNNPTVDHSGPTTLVRYADGTVVDTGLPTEAALSAKASNDYKTANMDSIRQSREDAITQRRDAAAASVQQKADAAKQASLDRENALQVARINANAGRFGQPIPGNGTDGTGKTVPGAYIVNGKTGDLEFHPGVVLTQKDAAGASDAQLKPEAIKFYGEQLARGDTSVLQNLGRGPVASKNAIAVRNAAYDFATANKMDPSAAMSAVAEFTGQKAAERVLGTTSARIGLGASELEQLIPQALDASKALPRSQFPTANSVMQAVQSGTGDPRVRDLGLALQAAKGAYSQVLTRGGMPTDSARATADELFATKDPETVLGVAMDRVRKETAAIRRAPGMVRHDLRNDARGQVSGQSGSGSKYQEGQVLHQGGNLYKVVNGQPVYQGKAN